MKRNKAIALPSDNDLGSLLRRGLTIGKNALADSWSLAAALFRAPRQVGAITPSGRVLADAMAGEISSGPGIVVELGGGTGSITAGLLRSGVNPKRLIVVEQDGRLCERLRRRFPQIRIVAGDACLLPAILHNMGITEPVKAVVSSLPVLTMSLQQQGDLLGSVASVTGCGGIMIQFTYGLRCPVPAQLLHRLDLQARRRAWIWRNVPPATVWRLARS